MTKHARGTQCALLISLLMARSAAAQDMALSQVLIDGEGWELVAEGFKYAEGPAVDSDGTLYFADSENDRIYKLDGAGKPRVFARESGGTKGMRFGPDGRLVACQAGKRRIVAYDKDGKESAIAEGVDANDLVVTRKGGVYFTDAATHRVWFVPPKGAARVVDAGLAYPNGITLWPDQGTLVIADTLGPHLWAYRIEPDGGLAHKQPYYPLQLFPGRLDCGADGMTVDSAGRLYVATLAGLQVFDPTGRFCGVILSPAGSFLTGITFGGPERDMLYATCMDKIYRRKTKATGISPSQQ